MKTSYDLSQLDWTLSGWTPYLWQFTPSLESGSSPDALVSVPAKVPGSVQQALLTAGLLPDWNVGLNARLSSGWKTASGCMKPCCRMPGLKKARFTT